MKKLFLICLFLLASAGVAFAQTMAEFDSVWIDHNVRQNGAVGMTIHCPVTIHGHISVPCVVGAYVYYPDGSQVAAQSTRYSTTDGQAGVFTTVTPAYPDAEFKQMSLFIPYAQLSPGYGRTDYYLTVKVYSKGLSKFLRTSSPVQFHYTR